LKKLAEADIVGPIAAQHCFLWMRCPAYRMVHQSACARANRPLEVVCEDHVYTYVIPFLCRWSSGAWHSVDTGSPIEVTVIGWRVR
jgi:hypothetical protein